MLILSIPKAADGNRTHDLFLTKEVLYRLSYSSEPRPSRVPVRSPRSFLFDSRLETEDFRLSGRWDSNPRHPAWKAGTLPLSYTRVANSECRLQIAESQLPPGLFSAHSTLRIPHFPTWAERDLNPRRAKPVRFTV